MKSPNRFLFFTLAASLVCSPALATPKKHVKPLNKKNPPTRNTSKVPAADYAAGTLRPAREISPTENRDTLSAFGLILERSGEKTRVLQVLPGSIAHEMGFVPDDVILAMDGRITPSPAETAAQIRAWPPRSSISGVVRRSLEAVIVQYSPKDLPLPPGRSMDMLTKKESVLQRQHAEASHMLAPEVVRKLPTPNLSLQAKQTFWITLPKGIPAGIRAGDVLKGETVTPLVAESDLDVLALPPRSTVWLQVLSSDKPKDLLTLKLCIYKLLLANGHAYPCLGRIMDITGDQVLTQVSPGGTIVTAAAPSGNPPLLLPPDTQLKAEFLTPVTLHERPSFYQSGVGMWIRAKGDGKGLGYEVAQILPSRSAAIAGILPGDIITQLDGIATDELDFPSAVEKLYGPVGSTIDIRIKRAASQKDEVLSLERGATHEEGLGFKTTMAGTALEVTEIVKDSPSDKAGLRRGDRIVKVGKLRIDEIPGAKLQQIFSGNLTEENAITVQSADSSPERTLSIKRGWVRASVPPPYRP